MNIKSACLFGLALGGASAQTVGESASSDEGGHKLGGVKNHPVSGGSYFDKVTGYIDSMRDYFKSENIENDAWEECIVSVLSDTSYEISCGENEEDKFVLTMEAVVCPDDLEFGFELGCDDGLGCEMLECDDEFGYEVVAQENDEKIVMQA